MANVIQCPTCSKQFKLPDRPPATFACTACSTVMDLSAFRAAAPPAPAAAPAAPAAPAHASRGAGAGRPGKSRSARPGGAAAARARRARAAEEGDEEEGGRRGLPPPKKNTALILSAVIGLVVILGIALVVMNSKKRQQADTGSETAKKPAVAPVAPPVAPPAMAGDAAGTDGTEKPKPPPPAKGTFHPVDHHPDATPAERQKIDDLIQKAVFENAGRDSLDAAHELEAIGMKAVPRLINVFNTVKIGSGFDNRMGLMQASIADATLRKIDGYMERKRRGLTQIKAFSDQRFAESTAKAWIGWWDSGGWKSPEKPWDPRIDGNPDEPAAMSDGAPAPMSDGAPAPMSDGAPPDGK